MKVGDLSKFKGAINRGIVGIIVVEDSCGWMWILTAEGRELLWPPGEMEVINVDD